MATKKNKKAAQSQEVRPEQYLRTRVRQLPIYKCYNCVSTKDSREMVVVVARQHTQGNITFGVYMLDTWCLGVTDAIWKFNTDKSDMNSLLNQLCEYHQVNEISYSEAHNWVYGAHDWAAEAGILPSQDFALAKYILEPDDDKVELIEYDFGKDGEYCLHVKTQQEASKYIPTLKKNLGDNNYKVEIEQLEGRGFTFGGFKDVPTMKYTYKGKKYPKTVKLNHPEVRQIVETELNNITDEQIDYLLALPADSVREDLHSLIMLQIGLQWGKSGKALDSKGINWPTVSNSLTFLTQIGTVEETLPIILEVLRQSEDFLEFNFGDIPNILLSPAIYSLCKERPSLLMPFLLEKGPDARGKIQVLELLEYMAQNLPELREELVEMAKTLLEEYSKDLPSRTICDGTVVAFAIGIPLALKATELQPLVEVLYATELVDESIYGHIDNIQDYFRKGLHDYKLPMTDPRKIRDAYIRFIKQNSQL